MLQAIQSFNFMLLTFKCASFHCSFIANQCSSFSQNFLYAAAICARKTDRSDMLRIVQKAKLWGHLKSTKSVLKITSSDFNLKYKA